MLIEIINQSENFSKAVVSVISHWKFSLQNRAPAKVHFDWPICLHLRFQIAKLRIVSTPE